MGRRHLPPTRQALVDLILRGRFTVNSPREVLADLRGMTDAAWFEFCCPDCDHHDGHGQCLGHADPRQAGAA
jgi:hypothetical protein